MRANEDNCCLMGLSRQGVPQHSHRPALDKLGRGVSDADIRTGTGRNSTPAAPVPGRGGADPQRGDRAGKIPTCTGSGDSWVLAHAVMRDAIDLLRRCTGRCWLAGIRGEGGEVRRTRRRRPGRRAGQGGAVLPTAGSAERRQHRWDDGDVIATRRARALVGGVMTGSGAGRTVLLVSGGARHRARRRRRRGGGYRATGPLSPGI